MKSHEYTMFGQSRLKQEAKQARKNTIEEVAMYGFVGMVVLLLTWGMFGFK